jgi:hypothetical protein
MRKRSFWLMAIGLVSILLVLPPAAGMAGEPEQKPQAPTESKAPPAPPQTPVAAENPAGLVGAVIAFVPASRTLVVDVFLGPQVLRVGAVLTNKTRLHAAGVPAPFDLLKPGARVRIQFRRVEDGDEATSVDILPATRGQRTGA